MRAAVALRPARREQRRHRVRRCRGLRRRDHRNARRRDQALQRHLREDRQHDHHHEGTQIAAPEQHQRARAAAVRQHHAVAEQQAAEEHHRRRKRRLQIDRLADIDETCRRQQLRRGNRHADRQRIGADQPAVAFRQPAAHAAHQAEAARAGRPSRRRGRSRGPGQDDDLALVHRLFAPVTPAAGSRGRATNRPRRRRRPWPVPADRSRSA